MSCGPNEHRCGCNDPIDGPNCENCGGPATEADLRTFPAKHYVCSLCDTMAWQAWRIQWNGIDAAQAAIGNHLSVGPASWDPYVKASQWWESVNRTNRREEI